MNIQEMLLVSPSTLPMACKYIENVTYSCPRVCLLECCLYDVSNFEFYLDILENELKIHGHIENGTS